MIDTVILFIRKVLLVLSEALGITTRPKEEDGCRQEHTVILWHVGV